MLLEGPLDAANTVALGDRDEGTRGLACFSLYTFYLSSTFIISFYYFSNLKS